MDVMAMNPLNICLQEFRVMADTSDRGGLLGHFQKKRQSLEDGRSTLTIVIECRVSRNKETPEKWRRMWIFAERINPIAGKLP